MKYTHTLKVIINTYTYTYIVKSSLQPVSVSVSVFIFYLFCIPTWPRLGLYYLLWHCYGKCLADEGEQCYSGSFVESSYIRNTSTYIHTYIYLLPSYIHTYIHTDIHTYIHTCEYCLQKLFLNRWSVCMCPCMYVCMYVNLNECLHMYFCYVVRLTCVWFSFYYTIL